MDIDQLKALRDEGLTFGSHSSSHSLLSFILARSKLLTEIRGSQVALQEMLGVQVRAIAYPGGHVNRRARSITARYYDLGFATHLGLKGEFGDPYLIPRFDPSFCGDLEHLHFEKELSIYSNPRSCHEKHNA
jgi:peptidoglycan/xylan/chitin deacetylase (PgdA/CDA1 family)